MLLVFGWFLSGGDAPDYIAADQDWTDWADENRLRSGIGAFLVLLAGLGVAALRGQRSAACWEVLRPRSPAPCSWPALRSRVPSLAPQRIATAIVMVAAATSEGADADPVVSRAVTTASAGPYLVAAMGFAALLGAAGLVTLRSGVLPRWTGIVALIGAVAFLITLLTVIAGTGEDSVFGYGFLPGILALVTWSIATSIATYRTLATTARGAR